MFDQKRLYLIALCVYLVLTVLLFAQLSLPSVADPSHPPKDRPSYHDLFEEPVRDRKWTTSHWMSKLTDVLPNSSPFSTPHEASELPWPRPPSPNPYRAPGTFLSDSHHLENNQWVPIDASIPPAPPLLKTLQQGPEAAGPEYSWFQNRTVLLLSDSMGREHLHAFCTWWTFREPEIFGPQHESYPKFALEMEAKYSPGREYNFAMYGRRMRCHHGAWSFTMFYYFMGSFDDTAEQVEPGWSVGGFWEPRTAHWTPPVHPIDRVQSVMKPIMDSYGREPDLIEIGLSAWSLDAQKIADHDAAVREAVIAGKNQTEALEAGHLATKTHLSIDFVRTWRERLADFVDQVRTLYGSKPPILYRLMQLTDQHYEYPKFFVDHRTATINNAAITVPTLEIDYWGDMIRGNEAFGDWIHPGLAPKYLWMEMMLFRLWEAVTDAADGRRYKMPGSRKAEVDGEISDL